MFRHQPSHQPNRATPQSPELSGDWLSPDPFAQDPLASRPPSDIPSFEWDNPSLKSDPAWVTSGYEASKSPNHLRRKLLAGATAAGIILGGGIVVGESVFGGHGSGSTVGISHNTEEPAHGNLSPSAARAEEARLEQEVLVQPPFTADQIQEKTKDLNHDPIFRASSLMLYGETADGRVLMGSGGLVDHQGQLEVTTIGHVSQDVAKLGVSTFYASIPSVGVIELGQLTAPPSDNLDEVTAYALTDDQQKLLRLKAKQGVITPLEEGIVDPKAGDTFTIADPVNGKNVGVTYLDNREASLSDFLGTDLGEGVFVVSEFNDSQLYTDDGVVSSDEVNNLQQKLQASASTLSQIDMICQGFSGSPLVQGNKMVGSLAGGLPLVQNTNGQTCGEILTVRLNDSAQN